MSAIKPDNIPKGRIAPALNSSKKRPEELAKIAICATNKTTIAIIRYFGGYTLFEADKSTILDFGGAKEFCSMVCI